CTRPDLAHAVGVVSRFLSNPGGAISWQSRLQKYVALQRLTWKMPANWRHDMLNIVLGEQDEDSFMVIELSEKILKYKFVLETVSELFDLGKADSECFEYIASSAHT
nr:hypothetical protein [Tanacetum cinerariifolium]